VFRATRLQPPNTTLGQRCVIALTAAHHHDYTTQN